MLKQVFSKKKASISTSPPWEAPKSNYIRKIPRSICFIHCRPELLRKKPNIVHGIAHLKFVNILTEIQEYFITLSRFMQARQ